jgi:hypothetical protein
MNRMMSLRLLVTHSNCLQAPKANQSAANDTLADRQRFPHKTLHENSIAAHP